MKRIVVYARVSGSSNQEKEETIETQLAEIHKTYEGQSLAKEYTDVCSGAYLSRPGLNQLRDDAKKGMFDEIVVYSLDRLSRKLGHQIALLEEFEKLEIEVDVLGEKYENSPEGMLNRNIRGAFSEYERYKIAKRMRDGKYRKVGEGKLVASYPPFGYRYIKKTEKCKCEKMGENHFEINQEEAKVVRKMFKVYLETQSQRKTAKKLKELGLNGRSRWKRNPAAINYRLLGRFLRNETYIGNYYFGRSYFIEPTRHYKENPKSKLTHRIFRPKEEWRVVKVPAIIPGATFEATQEILKEKAKSSLKPTKHQYLCQGLIKCAKCKRRYSGGKHDTHNGKPYLVYRCPQKYRRGLESEQPCKGRTISVPKLDEKVWDDLSKLLSDRKELITVIQESQKERETNNEFNQTILGSLISKKGEIKQLKSRILDLYADGKYKKEDLDDKIMEMNNQEELIDQQIKEVKREMEKIESSDAFEEEVERASLEFKKESKDLSFEKKRMYVQKWVREITIPDKGQPIMICRLPERYIKALFVPGLRQKGAEQVASFYGCSPCPQTEDKFKGKGVAQSAPT